MSQPTVLITGISRGIGRACAQRFHDAGYHLLGCSRNEAHLHAFADDFPTAEVEVVDMGNKTQVVDFGYRMAQNHSIDVLVNNAGAFLPGALLTEEDGVYEHLMRVNVDSVYYLTKQIAPQMRARRSGAIINLCSVASIKGYPAGGSYTVSKHALLGLSRSLREELKPDDVRVCSILPSATLTDSWAGSGLPDDRFMTPESIAEVIYQMATLPYPTVLEEVLVRPQLGDI